MRRAARLTLPLLLLGTAVSIFVLLTLEQPAPAREEPEAPVLLIEVGVARAQPVTFSVDSQGTVTAAVESDLVSQVGGQIVEVSPSFVNGGFFGSGSTLVRLDDSDYEIALRGARSNLVQFTTEVDDQRVLAEINQRYRDGLRDADPDTIPVLADLRRALAGLDKAEAELAQAELNLSRTAVMAPYDGMIVQKMADLGQVVGPRTLLASMVATDYAEVRLPVAIRDLRFLDESLDVEGRNLPVELNVDLGGGESSRWHAAVVRSEGVVDPTSRVIYLVARIEDPYDRSNAGKTPLRFGSFVTARISGRDAGKLFVIPRHVVRQGDVLWVVNAENELHPRRLTVERRDDRFAYVSAGLEEGERYCLTPLDEPIPGTRVRFDE